MRDVIVCFDSFFAFISTSISFFQRVGNYEEHKEKLKEMTLNYHEPLMSSV